MDECVVSGRVIDKTLKYLVFQPIEFDGKSIYIRLTEKTRRMQPGDFVSNFEIVHDDFKTIINGKFTSAIYSPKRAEEKAELVDLETARQKTISEVRKKYQEYVDAGVLVPERLVDRMRVLEDEEGIKLVKKWRIRYWHLKTRNPNAALRVKKQRRELECVANYIHFYVSEKDGESIRRGGLYTRDGEDYVIAHMKLMDVPTPESEAAGFTSGGYYNLFCYKASDGKLKVYQNR